jgi:branched-chain amino acid transport system permease protein
MFWLVRLASVLAALGACFLIDSFAKGMDSYSQRLIVLAGLYVTLSVSLNLINGITGQFSIGHAAFYQVGAYIAAYFTVTFFKTQPLSLVPWMILMIVVGACGAAIAGFVVGLPSLRLRGDYLAIVTLGFGEIIRIVTQNIENIGTTKIGGAYGMNVEPKAQFIWLVWLLAIVCVAVCRNLLKTAHGLPFLAVREDEIASSAMGVNTSKVKVTAFVIGSAFAGAAGALFAHNEGFISPGTFPMDLSFIILTMVVLGGTGSITGSVVAGLLLFYFPEWLRGLKNASGGPLALNGNWIVAALIVAILLIAAVKRIADHYHGPKGAKIAWYVGAVVGAVALHSLLSMLLKFIPSLAAAQYEVQKLRMIFFALMLIFLMLVRPQGVFGHHEFSWRLFARKRPQEATA